MTTRELTLVKAILNYLQSLDGGQADEIQIHRDILGELRPPPSALEVRAAMAHCDAQHWITGIPARFTHRMKWNLNDAGAAARLEM